MYDIIYICTCIYCIVFDFERVAKWFCVFFLSCVCMWLAEISSDAAEAGRVPMAAQHEEKGQEGSLGRNCSPS